MSQKSVLLIKHSNSWSGDRCSAWFEAQGYQLSWCYPADGQHLPDPAHFDAAVVYGGRNSVNDREDWIQDEHRWLEACLKTDCRFLGICFGGQLLAKVLGARVEKHSEGLKEIGFHEIRPTPDANVLLDEPRRLFQWHGDGFEMPSSATPLASGDRFPNQAFSYDDKAMGFQFHPEVNHTVASQWFASNEDFESEFLDPCSREAHLQYARESDADIDAWFAKFMSTWLVDPA